MCVQFSSTECTTNVHHSSPSLRIIFCLANSRQLPTPFHAQTLCIPVFSGRPEQRKPAAFKRALHGRAVSGLGYALGNSLCPLVWLWHPAPLSFLAAHAPDRMGRTRMGGRPNGTGWTASGPAPLDHEGMGPAQVSLSTILLPLAENEKHTNSLIGSSIQW